MERAENTARMLDVNYQTSLLPQSATAAEEGLASLLSISELSADYAARFGAVSSSKVMVYMVSDPRNPSSICSCLRAARENARAVRGTLTTEVWETVNQTWLEYQRQIEADAYVDDPSDIFEWVKFRSHLSRGVTVGTMLHDHAFYFLRIGSFIERADNTARLLDVKFQRQRQGDRFGLTDARGVVNGHRGTGEPASRMQTQTMGDLPPLPPPAAPIDAAREIEQDFYHWSALLRSISGFEVYRKVYRDIIRPERVAELLILRPDMPRSLAACMNELLLNLREVANEHSAETLRAAGRLAADLQYARIDEIIDTGLHAFLTRFLERIGNLGECISRDFLVPVRR